MKTIEESNRMIAEFMSVDISTHEILLPNGNWYDSRITHSNALERVYPMSTLQYHTSWEWLMPVVQKIKDVSMERWMLDKLNLKRVEIFKRVSIFSSLDDVCDCALEFIEWYNENK